MKRLVTAALVLLMAAPAAAQPTLWEQMTDDAPPASARKGGQPPAGLSAFEREMWLGRHFTIKSAQAPSMSSRILAWRTARNAYDKAIAFDPNRADAHLQLAELLASAYRRELHNPPLVYAEDQVRALRDKAIYHWEEFERLAPRDPRITQIRNARSLDYTKRYEDSADPKDLERALDDYRGIMLESDLDLMLTQSAARILGNRAEIHMMLGEMSEAITWYEAALRYTPRADWAFGLAVAYDRDGQGLRAREKVAQFATNGSVEGFAKQLMAGDVFFVPAAEVYYYFGLIHETLGNYDLAADAFERFVRSGAHPVFQPRARDNIKKLRAHIAAKGPTENKRGHWSRLWHVDYQRELEGPP